MVIWGQFVNQRAISACIENIYKKQLFYSIKDVTLGNLFCSAIAIQQGNSLKQRIVHHRNKECFTVHG